MTCTHDFDALWVATCDAAVFHSGHVSCQHYRHCYRGSRLLLTCYIAVHCTTHEPSAAQQKLSAATATIAFSVKQGLMHAVRTQALAMHFNNIFIKAFVATVTPLLSVAQLAAVVRHGMACFIPADRCAASSTDSCGFPSCRTSAAAAARHTRRCLQLACLAQQQQQPPPIGLLALLLLLLLVGTAYCTLAGLCATGSTSSGPFCCLCCCLVSLYLSNQPVKLLIT